MYFLQISNFLLLVISPTREP